MADEKKEEKKAEAQAEAEAKLDKEPSKEEGGSAADEKAEVAAEVSEATETKAEVPAEVEAINTDNETAKEANEVKPEVKAETKPEPTGFGVSAAAPMMAVSGGAAGVAGAPAEEEKASYTLVLADSGAQKIAVIKALREINQELGLKEAKDLADGAPKEIKKDMPKADAEEAKKKLEAAGAKVELK
jgi:large subunit ribosomal protein L7/L12